MTPLDGLSDTEYQDRYERACQLRSIGSNTLAPDQMQSLVLDLVSRPRSDMQNKTYMGATKAEEARDYWDLADWMRFLHKMHYKPHWRADIEPEYAFGQIRYSLRVDVSPAETPYGPKRLSNKVMLHPEIIRSEIDARRFLRQIIDNVEYEITEVWLSP